MDRSRAAACIVALVLLVPTALAAPQLHAASLLVAGDTLLEGDASALFFVSERDGVAWEASASSATLVREYATFTASTHPANDGTWLAFLPSDWMTEEVSFGALTLASRGTAPGGAMLVASEATSVAARSSGLVEIAAVTDPRLGQDEDATAGEQDRGEIVREFAGQFLNATFHEGVFTLTGELTFVMYGPSYATTADGETVEWRTGEFTTNELLFYTEGRQERHTLTLHDAVLQVRASEPTTLLTTFPTLDVEGTIKAPRAEGALALGGADVSASDDGAFTYTGAARLALAPVSGRVGASTPDVGLAATGATVPAGPSLLPLGFAGVLLLALVAGALLLRRRQPREDDLALALLAMEERRWNDALPRLTRVARRQPTNAHVLIDRALCLEQVGRFADAAKAFEVALRAAPKHAEAHFYYARTLAKMREKEAARVHLETALERDPRLVEMARAETVLHGL